MSLCKWIMRTGAALSALMHCSAALAQHAGDVVVGRTAGGQLAIGGFPVEQEIILLPAVNGPLLFGWSDNDPGFDHVTIADPPNDLFPLQAGAQIRLEVLDIDPAFRAIDASFQVLDAPGESTLLGDALLHVHLIWHINSISPAFDPEQVIWQATLRLVDTGSTGYAPSEPFTMTFTNTAGVVPTMSEWAALAMAGLLLAAGGLVASTRNRQTVPPELRLRDSQGAPS